MWAVRVETRRLFCNLEGQYVLSSCIWLQKQSDVYKPLTWTQCLRPMSWHTMQVTQKLGGENYVFWGGREGYQTLLNTDLKKELDHMVWLYLNHPCSQIHPQLLLYSDGSSMFLAVEYQLIKYSIQWIAQEWHSIHGYWFFTGCYQATFLRSAAAWKKKLGFQGIGSVPPIFIFPELAQVLASIEPRTVYSLLEAGMEKDRGVLQSIY